VEFFDDKQEVMDVVITPYGKYLLSVGKFRPEYYAFFDDGILYDAQWAGTGDASITTEAQNDIEGRIQHTTPRIKQPSVYTGVETVINTRSDIIVSAIDNMEQPPGNFVAQDTTNHKIYNQESLQQHGDKFDFLSRPLGRSAQSSNNLPAWNISMLVGAISSSQDYVAMTNGIERIPQLNITCSYKIYVDETSPPLGSWATTDPTLEYSMTNFPIADNPWGEGLDDEVSGLITPDQFSEIASIVFDDGTYFSLENGKLLIEFTEENVQFKKENFDIQVFASGSQWSASDTDLKQLHFTDDITDIQNDDVERYLNIKVDRQISDHRIAGKPISDLRQLRTDPTTRDTISTREFLIRDLYDPEPDICD
tara:strand:+ start:2529 stop:3626 length:1098 start_codon:yes stop_codon:yes gene_type:complete